MRPSFLIILFMSLTSVSAFAEELPGLAALNFKAQRGVEDDLAEMISEAALSVLRDSKRFKSVIGSSDVAAMISAEQQKQALGCDDDSCLAQLGGALGVPYLLSGSLGMLGGRFMLNIKLLAVDEAKVAGRVTKMFEGERALGDDLAPALRALLDDAFGAQAKPVKKTPDVVVATVSMPSNRRSLRWLGLALGASGTAVGIYSFSQVVAAQDAYNTSPSEDTQQTLIDTTSSANGLLVGSLVSVGAGAGLWWWSR